MPEPTTFSPEEILSIHRAIGENVKKYRKEKGFTQLQLSYAMGYKSVSLISAAELAQDGKHFNLEHLYQIAKIFNIKVTLLFPENPYV